MIGIRQGLLNLFAIALYHAFEQQIMLFHRKNVLQVEEENDDKLFKMSEFQHRLEEFDIKITEFASWPKIDELRLLANAVKHAQGNSSHRLREIRPDLFEAPYTSDISMYSAPPIFQPLVGDGLYVALHDMRDYRNSLIRFWKDLAEQLQRD